MTDGRYETTYSLRPDGFDQRLLWTQTHEPFHHLDGDVRYRESCPYHDLKANGQFQPEPRMDPGDAKGNIKAEVLCARPPGKPMKWNAAKNGNFGCGGTILPEETEPLPPASPIKRSGKPWTSTADRGKAFSTPPYVSCPPAPPIRPPVEPHFHTGTQGSKMGLPYQYIPDEAQKVPAPIAFRLKTGTFKPAPLPPVKLDDTVYANPMKSKVNRPNESKKKVVPKPREPFTDNRSLLGTFGHYPRHIPEPYEDGNINPKRGGTLFTYWAKSKRSAPVSCPWSTMPQTNEPVRDQTLKASKAIGSPMSK